MAKSKTTASKTVKQPQAAPKNKAAEPAAEPMSVTPNTLEKIQSEIFSDMEEWKLEYEIMMERKQHIASKVEQLRGFIASVSAELSQMGLDTPVVKTATPEVPTVVPFVSIVPASAIPLQSVTSGAENSSSTSVYMPGQTDYIVGEKIDGITEEFGHSTSEKKEEEKRPMLMGLEEIDEIIAAPLSKSATAPMKLPVWFLPVVVGILVFLTVSWYFHSRPKTQIDPLPDQYQKIIDEVRQQPDLTWNQQVVLATQRIVVECDVPMQTAYEYVRTAIPSPPKESPPAAEQPKVDPPVAEVPVITPQPPLTDEPVVPPVDITPVEIKPVDEEVIGIKPAEENKKENPAPPQNPNPQRRGFFR